jgi:hypothetical protein
LRFGFRWGVRPHAAAKGHEASCRTSSIIGSAIGRPGSRLVMAHSAGGLASEERSQASAFVKILQFTRQRRFLRNRKFLLARRRCEMPVSHSLEYWPRGLSCPQCEPDCLPTFGAEKTTDLTLYPSVPTGEADLFARLVSPSSAAPGRKTRPVARGRRSDRQR